MNFNTFTELDRLTFHGHFIKLQVYSGVKYPSNGTSELFGFKGIVQPK